MKKFDLIVAATKEWGIGKGGVLPWRLPKDMAFFKSKTVNTQEVGKQNAVIMGRKTYLSIPQKFRPLTNRINIVLSRNPNLKSEENLPDEVFVSNSLDSALNLLETNHELKNVVENIYIAGGAEVFAEAMRSPRCNRIFFTSVHKNFECDTFLEPINEKLFKLEEEGAVHEDNGVPIQFNVYKRIEQ